MNWLNLIHIGLITTIKKIIKIKMTLKIEEVKSMIKEALPDAEITIQDLAGDENHYSATIKSKVL